MKKIGGMVLALMLSGCGQMHHLYKDYGVQPLDQSLDKDNPSASNVLLLRKAVTDTSDNLRAPLINEECVTTGTLDTCKSERNNAVASLMIASDDMCQAHLKTIFGNEASFNIITGSMAVLTSGVATVTNATAAKSTWAALSTLANAERSLVNEVVYKDRLITAVTAKIRQARDEQSKSIVRRFGESVDQYPVMLALNEVTKYHYTCSFMYGLEKALDEGIQPSTETKRIKLEQERQQLENYIDARSAKKGDVAVGLEGAKKRLQEIDNQLLAMLTPVVTKNDSAEEVGFLDKVQAAVAIMDGADQHLSRLIDHYRATGEFKNNLSPIPVWNMSDAEKTVGRNCLNAATKLFKEEQGHRAFLLKNKDHEQTIKDMQSVRSRGNAIAGDMQALASNYSSDEKTLGSALSAALGKEYASSSEFEKAVSAVEKPAPDTRLLKNLGRDCKP